jgi:perosamine synthetase
MFKESEADNNKQALSIISTIREHYGDGFIPLHTPCFSQIEKELLVDCIDSTFVSSVGQYVDQFEADIAQFTGAQHAVAVVNGTMGLMLALRVVGVQTQDLVITQSLTFVATANAIKMLGAEPIFCDVSEQTMGLDVASLRTFLQENVVVKNHQAIHKTTGQRIAACVPMHTLGMPLEIEAIVQLCHDYHIKVVEDAAESLGSYVGTQHTGTFGDVGVFSFNGNKIITTGGGGMLVTNCADYAQQAKHLSTTAKVPHAWLFEHDEVGYNLRMPNLNAALGVAQMQKLPQFLNEKRALAQFYQTNLQKQPGMAVFEETLGQKSNYWLNALVFDKPQARDDFLKLSNEQGIQTRPFWTPMHQQAIYAHQMRTTMPNTEYFAQRVVNIPSGVICGAPKT